MSKTKPITTFKARTNNSYNHVPICASDVPVLETVRSTIEMTRSVAAEVQLALSITLASIAGADPCSEPKSSPATDLMSLVGDLHLQLREIAKLAADLRERIGE